MPRKKKAKKEPDIDQKIRINEMREEFREMGGTMSDMSTLPPDIEEQFMKSVLDYEKAEKTTHLERLERDGLKMPPASKLNDEQLAAKIQEVIDRLTKRRISLSHTNHLSDREFYEWLRTEGLNEIGIDFSNCKTGYYHIDVLGSYGEEECFLYNKYYATKEEREKHVKEYPKDPLPPHEDPQCDRDRNLPQFDEEIRQAALRGEFADIDYDSLMDEDEEDNETPTRK